MMVSTWPRALAGSLRYAPAGSTPIAARITCRFQLSRIHRRADRFSAYGWVSQLSHMLLMPRSCTRAPFLSHMPDPHTRSWPYRATGVSPAGGGGLLGGGLLGGGLDGGLDG